MQDLVSTSADGLHVLKYHDRNHSYFIDGKRVVSATTAGKTFPIPKPLLDYMIREGIEEARSGAKLSKAGKIGTALHDYAYLFSIGDEAGLDALRMQIRAHPDCGLIIHLCKMWRAWYATQTDEIVLQEVIVGSPSLMSAGRFDRLVRREGKLILQDYKTAKGFFVEQFIQMGGYDVMLREWSNLNVEGYEVVLVSKKEDVVRTHTVTNPELMQMMRDQFRRNLETYRFINETNPYFNDLREQAIEPVQRASDTPTVPDPAS
jgi:hypothetical protein